MWQSILLVIERGHWGDVASIVGVLLALIGFGVTIWNVQRSKEAAESAASAAREAKRNILRFDLVEDLSSAIAILEEIKRLHRAGAWAIVPDRYTVLRKLLSSALASNPESRDAHKAEMVSVIGQLSAWKLRLTKRW